MSGRKIITGLTEALAHARRTPPFVMKAWSPSRGGYWWYLVDPTSRTRWAFTDEQARIWFGPRWYRALGKPADGPGPAA